MFLVDREIRRRISEEQLIRDYVDLETQLQPDGFDLTVRYVSRFLSDGRIDFTNENRVLSDVQDLPLDSGKWILSQGCYQVQFNEVVKLPHDLGALSIHRSSLMRNGAITAIGKWDSGYEGRGKTMLIVHNPYGLTLDRDARICQIFFYALDGVERIYSGQYLNEA